MGVAAVESAVPEATVELSAALDELPVLVSAGKKAGSGAGGSCVGLLSRPLSDSFPDAEVIASEGLVPVGG